MALQELVLPQAERSPAGSITSSISDGDRGGIFYPTPPCLNQGHRSAGHEMDDERAVAPHLYGPLRVMGTSGVLKITSPPEWTRKHPTDLDHHLLLFRTISFVHFFNTDILANRILGCSFLVRLSTFRWISDCDLPLSRSSSPLLSTLIPKHRAVLSHYSLGIFV